MLKRRNLVTLIAGTFLVASSAMAQFADRNIKFTNGVNEDHPVGVGVKKMQEVLAAKTGGKMKITAFWGGAAGGDLPATQALRAGTQEMVCTSSSPLVGIIKELGVFDLPFLFANEKEADAVLDGAAGKYFNAKLEAVGLVNLAYWENGFRNLTNSKRPVTKLEDFDGVKVRVMQNNIFLDTFKTLGTNAVPMAFGENADDAAILARRRQWADALTPGTWCKLFMQGQWSTARLLWVSDNRQFYLFGSDLAGTLHALSRRALERLRAEGLATSLQERSLMQRAVDSLVQALDG